MDWWVGTIGVVVGPPSLSSMQEYGDSLADVARWEPYVRVALARCGLPEVELEAGFAGTYPTFLAGPVVVKLFGYFPSWHSDHAAELAAQQLLRNYPELPAPLLVAHGSLYEGQPDPWPYLVTRRVDGAAVRDQRLSARQWRTLATHLGQVVRRVHALPPPAAGALARDWLRDHGSECAGRHRAWGSLPSHLVDQIDTYVVPSSPDRCLVHADLTADHVFVERTGWSGLSIGAMPWWPTRTTNSVRSISALSDATGPSFARPGDRGTGRTDGAGDFVG